MEIKKHLLTSIENRKVEFMPSPNIGGSFQAGYPDTIVIHYTAGRDAGSSLRTLCDPRTKASAHLVVGRNGIVYQLVPFNIISWHAGNSAYGGRTGLNRCSIGIEIDNAGLLTRQGNEYLSWFGAKYPQPEIFEGIHRNQTTVSFWHRYTEEQIFIVENICRKLIETYSIRFILGHEEIAPGRKTDPGPAFPLDKLRDRLLNTPRDEEKGLEYSTGEVIANQLNIRKEPSVEADKAGESISKGTRVKITGESGDWYQVIVETKGWVSKKYIKH